MVPCYHITRRKTRAAGGSKGTESIGRVNMQPSAPQRKEEKMKQLIAVVLAVVLLILSAVLAGCSGHPSDDLAFVKQNGKLVVGITDYPPMDYREDGSEEWIGFDADMAKAFAQSLGVTAEFVVIDWGTKSTQLDSRTIDCVWNGMTLNGEVSAAMGVSEAYCKNAQVVILPADRADAYRTIKSLKSLNFAVEVGSAGKARLDALGYSYIEVGDQTKAVMEVAAGTADAAVIDLLLAGNLIGPETSYAGLAIGPKLNDEEFFVVGFRRNSALVEAFHAFWKKAAADGSLEETAKKYGVQDAVIR